MHSRSCRRPSTSALVVELAAAALILSLCSTTTCTSTVAAAANVAGPHPSQRRRPPVNVNRHSETAAIDPEYTTYPRSTDTDPRSLQQTSDIDVNVPNGEGFEDHAARLRSDLLANYDIGSYPWDYAWSSQSQQKDGNSDSSTAQSNNIRRGLPIEIGINFHRVHAVDVVSSTADLIVWFRQRWTDPRLTWDPLEYNNITSVWFWIGDGVGSAGEMSEIWTPDLQLWNLDRGLEDSLSDTYAVVSNDGTVFWSRPGHLRPACKFQGLESFPFDALSCKMEFGSWSYSGLYVRPEKMDGTGYSIGGSDTAGQSYSEFKLSKENAVQCRKHTYPPFPGDPEADWPVLFYDVTFQRSWQPYARGYITIQVILNFAGFATFWLPVQCGERMGLSITALLAAVASELVVASSLPSASEMTWFQRFSIFSLVFAALALFESVAVLYFYYNKSKDLVPDWWRGLQARRCSKASLSQRETSMHKSSSTISPAKAKRDVLDETERISNRKEHNGDATQESSVVLDIAAPTCLSDKVSFKEENIVDSSGVDKVEEENFEMARENDGDSHTDSSPPSALKSSLLKTFHESDDHNASSVGGRHFDADDFTNEDEVKYNAHWKQVAHNIDDFSRVFFPSVYVLVLAVMLANAWGAEES